ncbi:hypothetical protein [uncultured Nocardioides sp.]|uniref:hypothetical protein n=1 Tax=uncultured Nocardioides sp. TaxID=198441 RepID=UPI00262A78F7|nr:hypothetical protein [uncultured Nocardioides sp.]
MTTSQDDLDMRVLEYLYDHVDDHTAVPLDLQDDLGYDNVLRTITGLEDRGLIVSDGRNGHDLTADGHSEVEAMLARRNDRGLRRRLCRDLLLRWTDEQGADNPHARVRRSTFDAAPDLKPFTGQETREAAEFLAERGLVKTAGGTAQVLWTTDLGRECLDDGGDVAAFLGGSGPTGGQVFHISGSGNSVAAAIGDGSNATANLSTFNHEQAVQFAGAVREALPALTLQGVDAQEVERHAAEIEQRQDPTRAQRATALLHRMVESTTTGTLGGLLSALGAGALGIG